MKVGYLGPQGSFSEEAALKVASVQNLVDYTSFGLIEALERGEIQKAVLPIENLIEGPVNWVIDFLSKNNSPFLIENEIILPIIQNLIGFGKISDVRFVYSHPQALAQCREFLKRHKLILRDDFDSTSEAVKLVVEKKDPEIAAIGARRAAEIHCATVIAENIGDSQNNKTRFIVLGKEKKERTGEDKTSFVFGTEDKPGALYRVLEVFDVLKINMTMIISRPSKNKLGEYVFFVDVESHQDDEDLKFALNIVKERVSFLKILGSFPKAPDR